MSERGSRGRFGRVEGATLRLLAGLAVCALLAGCATQAATPVAMAPPTGPVDTGTFPNLNVPPDVAAPTISDEEKAGLEGRLSGARSRQAQSGRGARPPVDQARLRRLAQRHGEDTLREIEGGS
jgi:hypothetical protein